MMGRQKKISKIGKACEKNVTTVLLVKFQLHFLEFHP